MRKKNRSNNKMNYISRGETGMGETSTKGNRGRYFSGGTPFILTCLIFLTLVGLPFSGSLLGIQSADAADVVTNGIFNGSAPWTLTQGGSGTLSYDSGTTRTADGSGSIRLNGTGRNTQHTGSLEEPLTLPAGLTVSSTSIYTNLATTHEGSGDNVLVQLVYTNDSTVNLLQTAELTSSGWTPRTNGSSVPLSGTLGVKAIRITMNAFSGSNNSANVDLRIDEIVINISNNATTAGTAQATAASGTSLSVSMPYSFDDNANNSCTVRYKQTFEDDTAWVTDAPACSDDGSTLTKTISGLTEGGYYDVEMTYNDPDTVSGTNPQVSYKVLLTPSNKTSADLATIRVLAVAGGAMEVLVRMPFENDLNGLGNTTYTIRYKLSSSGSWTTHPDSPAAYQASGLYKSIITGLTRDERYDIELTYNDADGVAGWGSPQTYTDVLMNPTIHNSYNYSMRKWGGKWGVVGGKYGEIVCTTCHERFPADNIKRIKQSTIVAPNSPTDQFPGEADALFVSFLSAVDGSSDFGDDSNAPRANSNRICEYCHSVPEYHRYDQQIPAGHFDQGDCMQCHNHATGFYPAGGQCKGCHNQAQTQLYETRQIVESSPGAGDGDFVKLSRHVTDGTTTEIVTNYDCAICHREADADIIAAGEGWLDLYNHKNGTTSIDRYVMLRNVDDINAGWKFNKNAVTEQMRTDMDTFCLSCHDADGASAITVVGAGTGLNFSPTLADARTPFNSNDTLTNGRDTMGTRTNVVDVKSQFNPGTYTWNADGSMPGGFVGTAYDGLPSQHNVLGPRYETINSNWTTSTWTGHSTRYGDVISNARETARLHCSDCHLNETNAHGASNSWYMLLNGTSGDFTSDVTPTPTTVVCYKCHSSAVYTPSSPAAGSRFSHDRESRWADNFTYATLGIPCLLCHAGQGYGHIHGRGSSTDGDGDNTFNGSTYAISWASAGTYTKQRFMPGAEIWWDPGASTSTDPTVTNADWQSTDTGNCYGAQSLSWTTCQQHAGKTGSAGSQVTSYGRPTRY